MGEYPDNSTRLQESRCASAGEWRDPSLDQPLDAIVYDVHPAFAKRRTGVHLALPALLFSIQAEPAKYKVPERFGMSAILGIMTALALLFGSFHILDADPVVYLFFGIQTLLICILQMFSDKMPRAASVIAGAIMAPLFSFRLVEAAGIPVSHWSFDKLDEAALLISIVLFSVPTGALLGYLTGTCAAGIFLVMDYLEPYLHGYALAPRSSAQSAT